jgi:hypothetical protein
VPKLSPPEWDPTPNLPIEEVEQTVRPTPIHFESLANNAFDFLQKPFAEVGTEPKYSVIHFYTGAELIFKARLLHEHWALVVTKVEEASLAKFNSGNFKSVTLQQAANRLRDIAEESFSREMNESALRKLGQHRNRIVHFLPRGVRRRAQAGNRWRRGCGTIPSVDLPASIFDGKTVGALRAISREN